MTETAPASAPQDHSPLPPPPAAVTGATFEDLTKDGFLKDFYKECGREATLAYTTLNQMKQWAITVQGAVIAAVAAFSKAGVAPDSMDQPAQPLLPVAGALLAYVFTLRFFLRAVLCYNNLQRWNTLQSRILEATLLARDPRPERPLVAQADRLESLRQAIQDYYYRWRAPIGRTEQLASNLKLGFGLLLALPPLLLVWSATAAWESWVTRALVFFACGATLIEAWDFFTSPFFDTASRRDRRASGALPSPGTNGWYVGIWALLTLLTVLLGLVPWIAVALQGPGELPTPH